MSERAYELAVKEATVRGLGPVVRDEDGWSAVNYFTGFRSPLLLTNLWVQKSKPEYRE